jgi:DnaJ-class molecular chaperone
MKDYYKILSVPENADQNTIKKAYRKLQMKCHPDKGGDPEKAKEINEAYDCLGDDQKKQEYDMMRKGGIPFGMRGHPGMNGHPGNMDNIFKMFFNNMPMHGNMGGGNSNTRIFVNGRPVNINRRPPDITKTLEISLEDAYNGKSIPINIERWLQNNNNRELEKETLYIPVEMGIDTHEIIVLKEKGNVLNNIKGDIKIHIKVTNNTEFVRKGLDLIYKKVLTLKEALTGFKFDIKHLNGKTLNINNSGDYIIEHNTQQLIRKYGMNRGGKTGSLIVDFIVEFPKTLTPQQKENLKGIL